MVDPQQREPGRGAYLHRNPECLDQAVRRRAVGRALKVARLDGPKRVEVMFAEVMAPLVTTGPADHGARVT
ncbi:MAG: COG2740: Predicted nucleic-acid-binding protein implicated in transcription termination [uncultured Propionibacteriaceae bacterium]|uniref:COG2740: Predicted nucleic-acid-binding protein implicated in transcription termination n=1 Tax=uncultured Propionibacteriaceae bacterium TaxID=257457 RepID=A0A6J4NBY4_9ACTN|nr:MAG: COG2740: Predicted nucleic-acid-binding protein implicated in transcription termination [uncultured Propionibacteriaceae bacterium]